LLNSIGGSGFAGANIFQYALAPEDEARQIARHLAGAGQRNVMVLAPSGSWGTRVANAFADELTRAGGQVVTQAYYDRASNDPTAQIQATLGITDSNSRIQSVRSITGLDLGFVARPRPDIDAIFVAGYEPDRGAINPLRLIYPVLNRHARDIPVFITRDALDTDTQANRDLLGAYLLDIPWNLETGGPVADLRESTEAIWKAGGASNSRYFAFGYDAAAVALAIRRPAATWPMSSLTGNLNLSVDGRVERNLQWARVGAGGVVQPADPAAK